MTEKSSYIAQYVGFKTGLEPDDFIVRWTPFAASFKSAGIQTIDLYQALGNSFQNYISRNVWDANTYFRNFPSGIAGDGSGGEIRVTQFGGYWLEPDGLDRQDKMILAFLTTEVEKTNSTQIARQRCSDTIPYTEMLDILPTTKTNFPLQIICKYILQI